MTLELIGAASLAEELRSKIELRTAKLCVVGLGYVGLPLAETFAWGGYPVLGFDIDETKVTRALQHGESYIGHISAEPRGANWCAAAAASTPPPIRGGFAEADVIIICVPTPLTEAREPDLSYIIGTGMSLHATTCVRASSSCWRAPPIPARPRKCCGRSSKSRA